MLHSTVSLGEALPEGHWTRFVVEVIPHLDLSGIYGRYASVGGVRVMSDDRVTDGGLQTAL